MNKTKFDLLVEHIIQVSEGRKPKVYNQLTIDFDKLESDIQNMSDSNPFKKIYEYSIRNMKKIDDQRSFTNEEMKEFSKTLPEWEQEIFKSVIDMPILKSEKKKFAERFYNFLKDPDREYFVDQADLLDDSVSITSIEENIFNFINQAEEDFSSLAEITTYMLKYGHSESETEKMLNKMVESGQLLKVDGKYATNKQEDNLDNLEPDDTMIDTSEEEDDGKYDSGLIYKGDAAEDLKNLGIDDPDDPFGDNDFDIDNWNYGD
jgi:hypothetical protein